MSKYYRGVAIVLMSAFCSALMPTFAKLAYANDVSVMTVLFSRFSLATIVLFGFLLLTKQNIRLDKRNLFGLFILGAVFNTGQSSTYFYSLNFIPASLAVLISYTYPAFTAIISSLWDREPITKQIAFSLISCFAGLILMVGLNLGQINVIGIILATAASIFYAFYVVLTNKMLKKVPPLIACSYISLFSTVGALSLSLFSSNHISIGFPGAVWLWMLGLAVCSIATIFFLFKGLKILGPTKASVLSTSEPLFGVIVAMILFQERLTVLQWLGAAGVIAGAVLAVYDPYKNLEQGSAAQPDLPKPLNEIGHS
jgi:drug/metabolite transporter (DMT)-like permease